MDVVVVYAHVPAPLGKNCGVTVTDTQVVGQGNFQR